MDSASGALTETSTPNALSDCKQRLPVARCFNLMSYGEGDKKSGPVKAQSIHARLFTTAEYEDFEHKPGSQASFKLSWLPLRPCDEHCPDGGLRKAFDVDLGAKIVLSAVPSANTDTTSTAEDDQCDEAYTDDNSAADFLRIVEAACLKRGYRMLEENPSHILLSTNGAKHPVLTQPLRVQGVRIKHVDGTVATYDLSVECQAQGTFRDDKDDDVHEFVSLELQSVDSNLDAWQTGYLPPFAPAALLKQWIDKAAEEADEEAAEAGRNEW